MKSDVGKVNDYMSRSILFCVPRIQVPMESEYCITHSKLAPKNKRFRSKEYL